MFRKGILPPSAGYRLSQVRNQQKETAGGIQFAVLCELHVVTNQKFLHVIFTAITTLVSKSWVFCQAVPLIWNPMQAVEGEYFVESKCRQFGGSSYVLAEVELSKP
jgi:hypothetical protein